LCIVSLGIDGTTTGAAGVVCDVQIAKSHTSASYLEIELKAAATVTEYVITTKNNPCKKELSWVVQV
jgi:hypothetical protein